jgi:hypothetical protein
MDSPGWLGRTSILPIKITPRKRLVSYYLLLPGPGEDSNNRRGPKALGPKGWFEPIDHAIENAAVEKDCCQIRQALKKAPSGLAHGL